MPYQNNDLSPKVKTKIDQVIAGLSKPDMDFVNKIAKQLEGSSAPINVNAIRQQASLHPGGANLELVVIAIIAILIGLLLPAVQKVRQAAAPSNPLLMRYNQAISLVSNLAV